MIIIKIGEVVMIIKIGEVVMIINYNRLGK